MLAGLAVSNIAWPHAEFSQALQLVRKLGLQGVEIAPYNVFASWDAPEAEIRTLRSRLNDQGLVCPALQGILFNVPGATLFGDDVARQTLARHLEKVAGMAELLGARACVLGAPKQRDPGTLSAEVAWEIAVEFLREIGPKFHDRGTALAFEANAKVYGCRFIDTTAEAIALVREVDTKGIALQIDTGTVFLEQEDRGVIAEAAPFAAHAHVSEPNLQPVGSTGLEHLPLAQALKGSGYSGYLSIEMRAVPDWQGAVSTAVQLVRKEYT